MEVTELFRERNTLWVVLFKAMESIRDEFFPGEPFYQAWTKIILGHHVFQIHMRLGRGASISELARRTGVPRQTVVNKMSEMVEKGFMKTTHDSRHFAPADFMYTMNQSQVEKHRKRQALLLEVLTKSPNQTKL